MNRRKSIILHWLSVALMASAVIAFAASYFAGLGRSNLESAAEELGHKVERRMHLLDIEVDKALHGDLDSLRS